MQIRQAERTEFDAVRRFYHAVIDAMEGAADWHASDAPRCAQGQSPAEKLYPACGFRCVDTVAMYYEDTGWTDFEMYEYVV